MSVFVASPWPLKKLNAICGDKEVADPTRSPNAEFSYLDIASVSNESFSVSLPKRLVGRDAPSRARKRIRRGDVIVATTRPYLKSIAQIPEEFDGEVCSTGFCVLRPTEQVTSDWLFFCSQSKDFIGQLTACMRGANYPAVTDRDVMDAEIPLPSVMDQNRIVTRIKECMERVKEVDLLRAESLQEANAVLPSVFHGVFEVQAKTATVKTIGALSNETRYGTSEKCHGESRGTPVLRIPNVAQGCVKFSDLKYCDLSKDDLSRLSLVTGDLLFVRTNGSRDLVGRSAVFASPNDQQVFAYASYLIRVRLDQKQVLPQYLSYFLNSTKGREELDKRRRTSAGQFNINSENLRTIPLPVPSLTEQYSILAQLQEREAVACRLIESLTESNVEAGLLRESILHKAFSGRL